MAVNEQLKKIPDVVSCRNTMAIILVTSADAKQGTAKLSFHRIAEYVYIRDPTDIEEHAEQLPGVISKQTRMGDASSSIDELLDFLCRIPVCETGITCAVFAHSQGAAVVKDALSPNRLESHLNKEEGTRAQERAREIRKNLAIFVFGGFTVVTDDLAKLVLNIDLEGDSIAQTGKAKSHGESGKSYHHVIFTGDRLSVERKETTSRTQILRLLGSAFSSAYKHFLSGGSGGSHALSHYVRSEHVMKCILEIMKLNGGNPSSCGCSASLDHGKLFDNTLDFYNKKKEAELPDV